MDEDCPGPGYYARNIKWRERCPLPVSEARESAESGNADSLTLTSEDLRFYTTGPYPGRLANHWNRSGWLYMYGYAFPIPTIYTERWASHLQSLGPKDPGVPGHHH